MQLDNDYENDFKLDILKNTIRLSGDSCWTMVNSSIPLCISYKENKRSEIALKGSANKIKDFWLILRLDRRDEMEPFYIVSARLKIINNFSVIKDSDMTYNLIELSIGKKIKGLEGEALPYGTQTFWAKIQPILNDLDISLK